MAMILDGKAVAKAINEKLRAQVEELQNARVVPTLAIVRMGERPDDIFYERSAAKLCTSVGIAVKNFILEETSLQEELLDAVAQINADAGVHGCLLLRPFPKHIDDAQVCASLLAQKDVDGITPASLAGVFSGSKAGYAPCTAQACMEILEYYKIDPCGKNTVVVGRSLVVGRPAAMLLLQKNATVTICHTRTRDLAAVCKNAQILLVAAGRRGVVGKDFIHAGQILLDVGINVDEQQKICGDVSREDAELAQAYTPVPGGVGTVTTSVLAMHVVEAARRAAQNSLV